MGGKPGGTTREWTDSRLAAERETTDQDRANHTTAAEDESDEILRIARRRAAEVLRTARERADKRMRRSKISRADRACVEAERAREDKVLRNEYARADKRAARERAKRARPLAELLSHARYDTDQSLLLERTDADTILARRDEFLGMVSHDLRNELSGITLSVGQILGNVTDDEVGRKIFRSATNIQRGGLRMSRLIGDLLDVVSIDVGKFTVVTEDHDAHRTVGDIVESFMPIASAKGIALTLEMIDDSLTARFDHQRIQQVLGNLLTNALQHSSEGGSLAVVAERRGGVIWFAVADSGSGIAPDRLPTIFDRFSQGARPGRKGLGLGLYIARCIVEAHGGRMWAESEPGRGSTFYFTLPLPVVRRRPRKVEPHAARRPASIRARPAG